MLPLPPDSDRPQDLRKWSPMDDLLQMALHDACMWSIDVGLCRLRDLIIISGLPYNEQQDLMATLAHIRLHLVDPRNDLRGDELNRNN